MKVKLIIFDMDGLMFQTAGLAYRGYLASAKMHDFTFTHEVFYYLTGRPEREIIALLGEMYGSQYDVARWRKDMDDARNAIIKKEQRLYKKAGLVELLEYAKKQGIQCVVASSNNAKNIASYLEMERVSDYFCDSVSEADVTHGKPNPEVFLKACEKTNTDVKNAIVLEDSNVGILAANRAGIFAIQIPDVLEKHLPEITGNIPLQKEKMKQERRDSHANLQVDSLHRVVDFLEKVNKD